MSGQAHSGREFKRDPHGDAFPPHKTTPGVILFHPCFSFLAYPGLFWQFLPSPHNDSLRSSPVPTEVLIPQKQHWGHGATISSIANIESQGSTRT
jgi:hypothetical protein